MYYTTTVLHLPFNLQFPTQHSTFLTTSSILLHMQWNLLSSQRHLLLKRPHSIKKPFLYNSKPSDFPFLTKDQYLFIGCASETTPFSQRFYFLFLQRARPKYRLCFKKHLSKPLLQRMSLFFSCLCFDGCSSTGSCLFKETYIGEAFFCEVLFLTIYFLFGFFWGELVGGNVSPLDFGEVFVWTHVCSLFGFFWGVLVGVFLP